MFAKTIAPETRRVLEKISVQHLADTFYLAGGTALAIHFGHRESIDLDFFSPEPFSLERLKRIIGLSGTYTLSQEEDGTLDGTLDNVKLTFLRYEYPLLYPLVDFLGVSLADERDIAAMKIDAISSRGSKKDFIDVYVLLEKYTLPEMIDFFEKKYSHIGYNKLHILKSLSYFVDAEEEPMPKMLQAISWDEVKRKISEEAKKMV